MKKEKLNLKDALKNLKLTVQYIKPYKGLFILEIIITLISTVLGVIIPLLSAKTILYLTEGKLNILLVIATITLIFEVTTVIFQNLNTLIFTKIFEKINLSIQSNLIKEIFKLETEEFDKNNTGVFIQRLKVDAREISTIFTSLNTSIFSAISSIGVLITIFILNKIMFLFLIFGMICNFIIKEQRVVKLTNIRKKYKEIDETTTGIVNEFIRGIRDIKVLNCKDNSIEQITDNINKSIDNKIESAKISFRFNVWADNFYAIFKFLFIALGCFLVNINNLTIENFVIIYMYKNDSLYLINEIIRIIDSLEDFNISASRVFEFINSQKYKKEHYGNVHIKEFKGSITFNNVNFSYNPKNKILKNMNFKINPNETIGFVGKSGAGKTTVLSLINKMYNVNDNMIFLDNYDINTLDESSITNNITLVTQNPYIFNMSIKDNLKIVSKKASLSKIKEVCKIACIHDFIMSLPDKYDTKIGEGGVALSGGQDKELLLQEHYLEILR